MLGDLGPKVPSPFAAYSISTDGTRSILAAKTGSARLLDANGVGLDISKNSNDIYIQPVPSSNNIRFYCTGSNLVLSFWYVSFASGNFICTTNAYQVAWSDAGLARGSAGTIKATNAGTGYGAVACGTTDAGTTTAPVGLTVGHNTSGTAAAGFGSTVLLAAQDSTTADQNVAKVTGLWATATHASRAGRLQLLASDYTGTDREGLRIESDGTQALIGAFGATAVAKPTVTGSKGANAALASLITALANLGWITDSTT